MSDTRPERRWTLEGARAVFPEVKTRTERAAEEVINAASAATLAAE